MIYLPNGMQSFENLGDLYYDLFMEIGVSVRASDHYLYDQETDLPIKFREKYIKASIDGSPVYAGINDIAFEPAHNYALMSTLFGFYLDKCQNSEDGDILGGYIANYIDDDETKEKQRVAVKTMNRGEISSKYYYNIYLAYIDCIFAIAGYNVDLSQFDIKPEIIKKK